MPLLFQSSIESHETSAVLYAEKNRSVVGSTVVFFLWFLLQWFNSVISIIPRFAVSILQLQFSVTLSLLLLLACVAVTVSITYIVVRLKYLSKYSTETTPQKTDKPSADHGPNLDYVTGTKKRGTDKSKNYLDEFLSAIKVFGYLERPVFLELTKNMTTQKLVGDELLFLDESMGFSIVVEGTMQVYTKMEDHHLGATTSVEQLEQDYDKDDILMVGNQRYHLLNEIKSGSPLCSLLSTLDLFRPKTVASTVNGLKAASFSRRSSRNSFDHLQTIPQQNSHRYGDSPAFNAEDHDHVDSAPYSPIDKAADLLYTSPGVYPDVYPDVVARARASDEAEPSTATIAIIPALAFQRVYSKFPKATSHIVAMVLARLYKVTFNAAHNYLGLTREIIDTEYTLNSSSESYKLPEYLVESVLEELEGLKSQQLFSADAEQVPIKQEVITLYPKTPKRPRGPVLHPSLTYVLLSSTSKTTLPGDLLSSVPLSKRPVFSHQNTVIADNCEESHNLLLPKNKRKSIPGLSYDKLSPSLKKIVSNGQTFSSELDQRNELTVKASIADNLLKILGFEEEADNYDGHLSVSSSSVGLTALLNDKAASSSLNKFLHESFVDGTKFDTVLPTSLSSTSHTTKVYPTFQQWELETKNVSEASLPSLGPLNRVNVTDTNLNYTSIKDALSLSLEINYYPPDMCLVEQDSFNTGLFFVLQGALKVSTTIQDASTLQNIHRKLLTVKAGGLAGYLSSIVGFKSLVKIKSAMDSGAVVAYISRKDFVNLLDKFYMLQLPIAAKLKNILPNLVRTIDFAVEWCNIPAGALLASQGDLANGFHLVISGRFRVVRQNKTENVDPEKINNNLIDNSNSTPNYHTHKEFEVIGEYGHGQSIGEVEVLTASRRSSSLIAVRDSETARIPRTLFEMLSLQNPAIMVKVSRIVANRVFESKNRDNFAETTATSTTSRPPVINSDYKTITILPTVSGLPVKEFADKLVHALKAIGRNVIALDQNTTLKHLGRHAFDERLSHLKLSGYFTYLEEKYETIVYVCDTPLKSNWTSTCISQGDCILLLADAEDDECATYVGDYERLLLKLKTTARTDLCLLHPDKSVLPGSTSIWLKNRIWVQDHHHINMEVSKENVAKRVKKKNNLLLDLAIKIASKANPNIKFQFELVKSRAMLSVNRLNRRVNKSPEVSSAHKNDFMRLARILSNEAVGLVLGGGGSRGISHVGVVTALEKHGIPVDIIGGTSIGSFVGGLYAKENNIVSIYGMSKKFSRRVGSIWRNVFDLTYPVTSYITGYEFNRGIWKVFGYHEIEDFWIKYFCNSTNITESTMEIHERGYAWRFIRASMSLAGLLPPIAFNGSMLLDGGYLDNLPVMEMKNKGAKYVIAVDVGSIDDRTPMNYGDTLSGFWVLWNRFNPFSKHPNVPNMMDIQLRLAYVASVCALEKAKRTPNVIYLRPPIDGYATLDFLKFDEIYNVGLDYADKLLDRWKEEGKFPKIAGVDFVKRTESSGPRLNRRNSI